MKRSTSGWVSVMIGLVCLVWFTFGGASVAYAGDTPESAWKMVKFETQWFLSYAFGEKQDASYNGERISRGYLTLKFKPVEWFTPRVTLDTHQTDNGSWAMRLKYLYGMFRLPLESSWISEPYIEFGLVHTPWFDFEEHVNHYRMQGTMFMERNGLLNSADAGVTVGGLIGEKLDKEYQKKVSSKYPGKFGSFALGVYNGGGYHAGEQNQNKVFEARLTVRPLGFVLPGLQLSYFFIRGKGNTETEPDWQVHDILASFEHEYLVLTGQFSTGKGNQKGSEVNVAGEALNYQGFSVFGEIKLAWIMSSLIGRFDSFDWDKDAGEPVSSRIIAGYAFHFLKGNFILLSYDRVSYDQPGKPADWEVALNLQVEFPL